MKAADELLREWADVKHRMQDFCVKYPDALSSYPKPTQAEWSALVREEAQAEEAMLHYAERAK